VINLQSLILSNKVKISNNTLQAVIRFFKTELMDYFPEQEINSMLYIVLDKTFDIRKKDVLLGSNRLFSESELLKIIYIVKDLKKHKPLAYILGEWEFYGLPFKINEHTLIPRPETEELVQLILDENNKENLSVLDIGTGSGCIAIALKKNRPNASVSAFDVSKQALETAKNNALLNDVAIHFQEIDILIPQELKNNYDIIVSNPPYIPLKDINEMDKNVTDFEPHLALFVEDNNPLVFYKAIAEFAQNHLTKKGKLYVEIHEKLGNEVKALFESVGFKEVVIVKDINEKDRIVKCLMDFSS